MPAIMAVEHELPSAAVNLAQALAFEAPTAPLAAFCSAVFRWSPVAVIEERFPALDAQLIIRVRGQAQIETATGGRLSPPKLALVGPLSGASKIFASDDYVAYGLILRPDGIRSLTTIPSFSLVDRAIGLVGPGLELCFTRFIKEAAALDEASSSCSLFQAILGEWFDKHGLVDYRSVAIGHWLETCEGLSAESLGEQLKLSPRQVMRIVKSRYGSSTKNLAMRRRAHIAAERLAIGAISLGGVMGSGFYDQSHLNREFRRFIGMTPHRLLTEDCLAKHMFCAARAVGARIF